MKFIKVVTSHTQEDIDNLIPKLDEIEYKRLFNLYSSFSYVEFNNESGYTAMYASMTDPQIKQLFSEFLKQEIKFSYEDITKEILFGNSIKLEDEQLNNNLQAIISVFIDENLDADVVLDKISEMGINAITELDRKVLEEH